MVSRDTDWGEECGSVFRLKAASAKEPGCSGWRAGDVDSWSRAALPALHERMCLACLGTLRPTRAPSVHSGGRGPRPGPVDLATGGSPARMPCYLCCCFGAQVTGPGQTRPELRYRCKFRRHSAGRESGAVRLLRVPGMLGMLGSDIRGLEDKAKLNSPVNNLVWSCVRAETSGEPTARSAAST